MILTDKAKSDFLEWNEKNEETFLLSYSDREITSLTIEWLDSVGFYVGVETECVYTDNENNGVAFYSYVNESNLNHTFYTRQEAIKQAIIKANGIYNERG